MIDQSCLEMLINYVCTPEYLVGSPAYGVIKYVIPEWDLTVLKRRVSVPMGEKIHKFGMGLRHGGNWIEWEISHALCVAQVHRLESFGVQHGRHVREYYVDHEFTNRVIPVHVVGVGDTQVLLDALTYLTLMAE